MELTNTSEYSNLYTGRIITRRVPVTAGLNLADGQVVAIASGKLVAYDSEVGTADEIFGIIMFDGDATLGERLASVIVWAENVNETSLIYANEIDSADFNEFRAVGIILSTWIPSDYTEDSV